MKLVVVLVVLVIVGRVGLIFWQEGVERMTVRPIEEVFVEALSFSKKTYELDEYPCPSDSAGVGKEYFEACFSTRLTAREFAERTAMALGNELREETGWRDDYGVLSAGFVFENQVRYTLGLVYQRRDSDPELRHDPALERVAGTVSVIVEHAVPLPGE